MSFLLELLFSVFLNSDKEYMVTAQLGILTDALDLTGSIVKECDYVITKDSIQNSIEELTIYSAYNCVFSNISLLSSKE